MALKLHLNLSLNLRPHLRGLNQRGADAYIKESGFATPPGSTSPNPAVADACADALSKIIAMQLPAAK